MNSKRAKMLRRVAEQYNKENPESVYKLLKSKYKEFIHDDTRSERAKSIVSGR